MDVCSFVEVGKDTGRNSHPTNLKLRREQSERQWQASSKTWKIKKQVDLFQHHLCVRQIQGRVLGLPAEEWPDTIEYLLVHCDVWHCMQAGPLFTVGGKEGSCALISFNCQLEDNLKFLVGTANAADGKSIISEVKTVNYKSKSWSWVLYVRILMKFSVKVA